MDSEDKKGLSYKFEGKRFPSERDFWTSVLDNSGEYEEYKRSRDGTTAYQGVAIFGASLYLNNIEKNNSYLTPPNKLLNETKEAWRAGGLWGAIMRAGDDAIDGHGCKSIDQSDREKFLNDFGYVLEEGKMPNDYINHPVVTSTLESGLLAYDIHSENKEVLNSIKERWDDCTELLREEDKSEKTSYLEYVHGASGVPGEIIVDSLSLIDGFEPEQGDYDFAHSWGSLMQIADDWRDDDIELEKDIHQNIYNEKWMEAFNETETIIGKSWGRIFANPNSYKGIMEIGKRFVDIKDQFV